MARRQWSDLSPSVRRVLVIGASLDAVLRLAALRDLARREQRQVRGSRQRWRLALLVVSSAGILPAVYFARGRLRS